MQKKGLKATALGFNYASKEWSNLGQGAPETGSIEDSPDRITSIPIDAINSEYSPVGGIAELKQAVADLYNSRYRGGKSSLYTQDNVAISSGGRAGLTTIQLGSCDSGGIGAVQPRLSVRFGLQECSLGVT